MRARLASRWRTALGTVAIATLALFLVPGGSGVAATVALPGVRASSTAVSLFPGGEQAVRLTFTAAVPTTATVRFQGLPATVAARVDRGGSREWQVVFRAATGAAPSVSLVNVVVARSSATRTVALAVAVVAPAAPPSPTTTPPVPTPPAPATRVLVLRPDNPFQWVLPGATAVFGLTVERTGWGGAVSLAVEGLPAGWRANFAPEPTTASSNLYVVPAANAAPGDYLLRLAATAGDLRAASLVVVHVPDPQLVVAPRGWIVTESGGVAQLDVDVRVFDDREPGGSGLTVSGLPFGSVATVAPTSVPGRVSVTIVTAFGTMPGIYTVELVGTKGARTTRVPMRLLVTSGGSATGGYRFTVTPVTPVAGQARGWGLTSSPAAWSVVRGQSVPFDVSVLPTGGFADPLDVSAHLPAGWSATFVPVRENVFRMQVTVPANAAAGTSSLTVTTVSGTLSAAIVLVVTVA